MAKGASLGLAVPSDSTAGGMVTAVLGWCEVGVMAPDGFDFERARAAIRKKLDEVTTHHKQHQERLNNPDFVAKAAPEMQEQMQQRAQELAGQQELLRKQVRLPDEGNCAARRGTGQSARRDRAAAPRAARGCGAGRSHYRGDGRARTTGARANHRQGIAA